MDWHRRTDETHTRLSDDGLITVLSRVRWSTPNGGEHVGDWHGRVTKHDGTVMMQAEDASRDVVVGACDAWLLALSVARERDPMPEA